MKKRTKSELDTFNSKKVKRILFNNISRKKSSIRSKRANSFNSLEGFCKMDETTFNLSQRTFPDISKVNSTNLLSYSSPDIRKLYDNIMEDFITFITTVNSDNIHISSKVLSENFLKTIIICLNWYSKYLVEYIMNNKEQIDLYKFKVFLCLLLFWLMDKQNIFSEYCKNILDIIDTTLKAIHEYLIKEKDIDKIEFIAQSINYQYQIDRKSVV